MCFPVSIQLSQPLNPQNEGRMIRVALLGVALAATAISSGAQNPTPTPPTAPSPEVKPTQPTPSPRAKVAPVAPRVWGADMIDLSDRLHALEDMNMDFHLAPPNVRVFDDFDLGGPDMVWGVTPPVEPMMPYFDFAMPTMPPEPAMIDMIPMMPMEPMLPMEPMMPMEPMEPVWVEPFLMEPMEPMEPSDVIRISPSPDVSLAPVRGYVVGADAPSIVRVGGQSPFERQFGGISSVPPEGWSQSDPADSLYKLARQALNRREYRRAAQLFGDITQKFPNSA